MPLMYYSRMTLEHLGLAVLSVHYDHRHSSEQIPPLLEPQMDELEAFLAEKPFVRYIPVGKSLGTVAMGFLYKHSRFASSTGVWLTPILGGEGVRAALRKTAKGLMVYGTADPAAQDPFREELPQTHIEILEIEGADHSLERDTPSENLDILKTYIAHLERFLR
jgi:hypothetical protein